MVFAQLGMTNYNNTSGQLGSPELPPNSLASPTSTVDSPDMDSPGASGTQDVFQTIVKGRKSWKTLRGGEVVWPPELEAALLEGLEKYQPDDSRETRLLGRFPMRNRFISDYIYDKTGKRRTAKQVGSRLQQLRDTCGGKRLLNLLAPCRRQVGPSSSRTYEFLRDHGAPILRGLVQSSLSQHDSDTASEASTSSMPPTPTDFQFPKQEELRVPAASPPPHTVVYIDLLPESSGLSSSSKAAGNSLPPAEPRQVSEEGANVVHISAQPRCLHTIDPTITFLAQASVSAQSHFVVYFDGLPVSSETSSLVAVKAPSDVPAGHLLYSTSLAPTYWDTIRDSLEPTRYTIMHQVVCDSPSSDSQSTTTMFSALYKFHYSQFPDQVSTPQAADVATPIGIAIPNDQSFFGFDDLLPIDPQCFPELMSSPEIAPAYYSFMGPPTKTDWTLPSNFEGMTFDVTDHLSSPPSIRFPVTENSNCIF